MHRNGAPGNDLAVVVGEFAIDGDVARCNELPRVGGDDFTGVGFLCVLVEIFSALFAVANVFCIVLRNGLLELVVGFVVVALPLCISVLVLVVGVLLLGVQLVVAQLIAGGVGMSLGRVSPKTDQMASLGA